MRLLVAVLAAVLLIGVCMAESHVIDADEWNTTVSDLVEGNDPRQHPEAAAGTAGTAWLIYGTAVACGLFFVGVVWLWLRMRRAAAKKAAEGAET